MATLPLQNSDQLALVDAADLAALRRWRWISLGGYVVRQQRTAKGSALIYLHRQLVVARPYEVVDHLDNDRLNNQRANLRRCSQSENLANRPSPRPEQFRGVYFEKRGGRWRAQITVAGKSRYLGTFATPELAALAYDRAARQAFGRFARLNLPDVAQEEQLALPLDDDPFAAVPLPASGPDWWEIRQEQRWRAARGARQVASFGGQVDNCGIPF